MKKNDIVRLLRRSFLFEMLSTEALEMIAAETRLENYKAGAVVVRKSAPGDRMMIVTSGRVKITSVSRDGNEAILNIIDENEVFAEMSILDGQPRSADAIAIVESQILSLSRSAFLECARLEPDIAIEMMRVLCTRIRRTTSLVEDTLFLDIKARLARRVQALAEQFGRPCADGVQIAHGLTQEELAQSIGVTRESVNKQLHAWQSSGLLQFQRGSIVVRNLMSLATEAGLKV